jgi:hypothetical protein
MIKKLIKRLFIPVLIFFLVAFTTTSDVPDSVKYEMYVKGIETFSTAPYYIVIKIKNQNSGDLKELCTEAPFLSGAIKREFNCDYSQADSLAIAHKDRYFEFSNDSALWNISYDLYSISDLEKYEKSINLDEMVAEIKSQKLKGKTFPMSDTRKDKQVMLAHLLFNKGIMTRRGCVAGNIVSFEIYNEKY